MLSRSFFHLRERNKSSESFQNSLLLSSRPCRSVPFYLLPLSLFLPLAPFSSCPLTQFLFVSFSRFLNLSFSLSLSLVNIPTTELSTPTVYLLLAMHLDRLIRSRSSCPDEIERKAHLPRSFIPILWRVNSRNREKERTWGGKREREGERKRHLLRRDIP